MTEHKRIDLHTHSTCSDGVHPPAKLVELATAAGLAALSLADHDSIEGYAELAEAAAGVGLEVIPGVELSCQHNGRDLHVLGYGMEPGDGALRELLKRFRKRREERGIRIVEKLNEVGVNIDIEDVMAKAGNGALGRPHIAETLLEGGYVSEFGEAFSKYIGENCPAYVDKYKMSPSEAVENIHASGGLAFVAHPGYYMEDLGAFNKLLDEGFDGVEVHHPHHSRNVVGKLLRITSERGLLVSGGSDFHGFAGRDTMGEPAVPYELFTRIKERLNSISPRG